MWVYKLKEFTEDMIPDGAVGFVYQMDVIIDGERKSYIGKKNFFADVKTKLSKKALSTDKRKKTYKRVRKTVYQNYYSSNEKLKAAHKAGVHIKRTILKICYSKTELSYQEVKYQFMCEVLEKDIWLNANILGRFYKQK
jgi:hypothetical protein